MSNVTDPSYWAWLQDPDCRHSYLLCFWSSTCSHWRVNLLISVTVFTSPALGSPMYFFLSYLSMIDGFYSSSIAPKLLWLGLGKNTISSVAAWLRSLLNISLLSRDCLVGCHGHDHYVAICKPLHYVTVMSRPVCAPPSWNGWGFRLSPWRIHIVFMVQLPFCGPNAIDHFMWFNTSWSWPAWTRTLWGPWFRQQWVLCLLTFLMLAASYAVILRPWRTQSSEGRRKALSTQYFLMSRCHLVLCALFGSSTWDPRLLPTDKAGCFCTIVTPLLNPLIYTLRNQEVKMLSAEEALGQIMKTDDE